MQMYLLIASAHTPPFWHGADAHTSRAVWQPAPEKPATQVHVYDAPVVEPVLEHVPPNMHGELVQGLAGYGVGGGLLEVWQLTLKKPTAQLHVYGGLDIPFCHSSSTQVPLF